MLRPPLGGGKGREPTFSRSRHSELGGLQHLDVARRAEGSWDMGRDLTVGLCLRPGLIRLCSPLPTPLACSIGTRGGDTRIYLVHTTRSSVICVCSIPTLRTPTHTADARSSAHQGEAHY